MELVTGATGYVGSRLIERLLGEGRSVRALARDPSRFEPRPGVEVVEGDVVEGRGLDAALEGCSAAYYLVHSMEAGDEDFAARDRRAAENFAAAASDARVVYLGGIQPTGERPSPHLASRLEVEEILLAARPNATALRASIVVGAGSVSFRILVRLVERLRVMPFPSWHDNHTAPVDERDAIEYLARTPLTPETEGRSLDIVGADVLSYGEMIERIAELMGVGRTPMKLRATQTPTASALVSGLTDVPLPLVRPLMESLEYELLPRNDEAVRIYGIRPRPFDRAVERALADWEAEEALAAR
jgi:uncharacterized protein YbjT (DUF2867 family)